MMRKKKGWIFQKFICVIIGSLFMGILVSCGGIQRQDEAAEYAADSGQADGLEHTADSEYTISSELAYSHSMDLDYAKGFTVDYYDGGYTLLTIKEGGRYLIVLRNEAMSKNGAMTKDTAASKDAAMSEDETIPKDLPSDVIILRQPVTNIYLAASAVMDMFVSMDALETIRLSGTKEDGWYIEEAKAAMASGEILYAGKYNMPDYELILHEDCRLAIESTMILHAPEVKEELEQFGIPVLTDRSSYEEHPLGRTEWVKLYGALIGEEEAAEEAFERQEEAFASVEKSAETKKTAAFFYITSNGAVSVRKSGDYVPKMIALAGGSYVFSDLGDESASSSVNLQMEEFYAAAKEADYLIYNSTIDGGVGSLGELLQKSELFADFKAYQTGNVFCTTQNLYQESMNAGDFMLDLNRMFQAEDGEDGTFSYLFRLK